MLVLDNLGKVVKELQKVLEIPEWSKDCQMLSKVVTMWPRSGQTLSR